MWYVAELRRKFVFIPTLVMGYDQDDTFCVELGWMSLVLGYCFTGGK